MKDFTDIDNFKHDEECNGKHTTCETCGRMVICCNSFGAAEQCKDCDEEYQRTQTTCVACGEAKSKGLVVCWNCFKHINNPYKESGLPFGEWLQEVKK